MIVMYNDFYLDVKKTKANKKIIYISCDIRFINLQNNLTVNNFQLIYDL